MKISVAIYKLAGLLSEIGDKEIYIYDCNGEKVKMDLIGLCQIVGEAGIHGVLIAPSSQELEKRIIYTPIE